MHFAISFCFSNANIVRYLVEKGANVSVTDNIGRTPLHLAAGFLNNIDIVEYLIKDKHVNVNAKDNNGRTPLHNTTESSIIEMVKYLVEKGADVNSRDDYGDTPLRDAISNNRLNIVRYLVDKGADISAQYKDHAGHTLLHIIAYSFSGGLDIAEYLIEKGFDINAKDNEGYVPLHSAQFFQQFRYDKVSHRKRR